MHKSESNKINDDTFSRESREEDLLEAFELNYKLLSHFQFYSTQNISEFINESLQSNIVANTIVEKIVNDGSKILYDKYVGTKMPQHVLNHSKEYLEMLNELEFRTHDQSELGVETLEEDQEPVFYLLL